MPRHLLGAFGEHPLTALRLPAAVAALAPDRLQRPMPHWQILDPRLAHVERAPAHQHPAPRAGVLVGACITTTRRTSGATCSHDTTRNPGRSNNNDVASLTTWPPADRSRHRSAWEATPHSACNDTPALTIHREEPPNEPTSGTTAALVGGLRPPERRRTGCSGGGAGDRGTVPVLVTTHGSPGVGRRQRCAGPGASVTRIRASTATAVVAPVMSCTVRRRPSRCRRPPDRAVRADSCPRPHTAPPAVITRAPTRALVRSIAAPRAANEMAVRVQARSVRSRARPGSRSSMSSDGPGPTVLGILSSRRRVPAARGSPRRRPER